MQMLHTVPQRRPVCPLPAAVVERIAAGEVIDRPASVVRELIENALDAHAASIRIEIRDGGLRDIRVVDDGWGIPSTDLELALTTHATSKISVLDDLAGISTLGFRGEALAGIAALSELRLCSAADDSGVAGAVTVRASGQITREREARSRGTTVTVRDLFADVPARRAILRPPSGEAAFILAVVRAYALIHDSVRITLLSDDQVVLATPGGDAPDAVMAIYGADVARALVQIAPRQVGEATISGWVATRAFTQRDTRHVVVAVNGRPVENPVLAAQVQAGYRPLLRKGRHPIALLAIVTDPCAVDANVHPAKRHVLLREERGIGGAMRNAVHAALGAYAPQSPAPLTVYPGAFEHMRQPGFAIRRRNKGHHEARPLFVPRHADGTAGCDSAAAVEMRELTPLAQLDNCLIVAQSGTGALVLVDQHRAHERLLYETLCRQSAPGRAGPSPFPAPDATAGSSRRAAGQLLLEPLIVELTRRQAEIFTARLSELAALGLVCEPFGGSAFLVRALPLVPDSATAVAAFASELAADAAEDADGWIDHLRISLACRSALRRGQPLAPEAQRRLLTDLAFAEVPAVCPHGSPIVARWPHDQLARLFEW